MQGLRPVHERLSGGAISMTDEINSRGYKHIRVYAGDCVGCGICYLVCPDAVFTIVEEG